MAVAFLSVMLVEWGSHSLAFAHAEPVKGMVSISNIETEHDDPCRTAVCCESRRNDQRAPNLGHELFPYAPLLNLAGDALCIERLPENPPALRAPVDRIFRPKDPLLHPPELS